MESLPAPLTSREHQRLVAVIEREAPELLAIARDAVNTRWLADDEAEALNRVLLDAFLASGHDGEPSREGAEADDLAGRVEMQRRSYWHDSSRRGGTSALADADAEPRERGRLTRPVAWRRMAALDLTRTSGRLATAAAAAALALLAAPAGSSAATIREAPLYAGTNAFTVSVPHTTGTRPPLVRYRVLPAGADCRLASFGYEVTQDTLAERKTGDARLRIRCGKVAAATRVRLAFGAPLIKSVKIRNGAGSFVVRADVPPGTVAPKVFIQTTPRGKGSCTTRGLTTGVRSGVFTLRGRSRCHGLPRTARAVMAVGGVIAGRASPSALPASVRARASASCPGADSTQLNPTTVKITERRCVAPGEWLFYRPYQRSCPPPYVYRGDPTNPWPGFTTALDPTNGWWSWGEAFGDWSLTNWSLDVSRTLTMAWYCQLGPPQNYGPPTQSGKGAVGEVQRCERGDWYLGGDATFTYEWLRGPYRGAATPIPGATGEAYTTTTADERQSVTCRVTGTNRGGSASANAAGSDPIVGIVPRNTSIPTLSLASEFVAPRAGNTLTCNPGAWDEAGLANPFSYQWRLNGTAIGGATGRQWRIDAGLAGSKVTCAVTARNVLGTGTAESAPTTIVSGGRIQ